MSLRARQFVGEVVDIFCGVGGISNGFLRAGFKIQAGYDIDESCRYAFETNNNSRFVNRRIEDLTGEEIKSRFSGSLPSVLVGCAPCQPFSTYKKARADDRWQLLDHFAELAVEVDADYFTMENVAGLLDYKSGALFDNFLNIMKERYFCSAQIIDCSNYGVPQRRNRLVVIGSKKETLSLPAPENSSANTVRSAIENLSPLEAGQIDSVDPLHRCSSLAEINLKRIRHSQPGGTWRDWPSDLVAKCHRDSRGKGYGGVYGRMSWENPAPTMTTQCYGYGNGRFGHPEQDRAISLREAAILQSFPKDYKFFEGQNFPGFKTVGRWIGNAVPVALAEEIAKTIQLEISENA